MGKAQREKGKRGERELASILRDYGYNCRRGQQYCGTSGDADVIGLPNVHIEVKRVEELRLRKALQQSSRDARAGEIPVVMHRRNYEPWRVSMYLPADVFGRHFRRTESTDPRWNHYSAVGYMDLLLPGLAGGKGDGLG